MWNTDLVYGIREQYTVYIPKLSQPIARLHARILTPFVHLCIRAFIYR
jgi:hypothetical protein